VDEPWDLPHFVVIMITFHPVFNIKMFQKTACITGIFRCNEIDLPENAKGPVRDIFQVADGRTDQIEERDVCRLIQNQQIPCLYIDGFKRLFQAIQCLIGIKTA